MASAPKPPPPPDPNKTANAQQVASVEVSKANIFQSNQAIDSPNHTIEWETAKDANGNDITIDVHTYNADGEVVTTQTLKKPKQVITFKPKAQEIFEKNQDVTLALNTWALGQVGLLESVQSSPLGTDGLEARLPMPPMPDYDATAPTAGMLDGDIGQADLTAHVEQVRSDISARLMADIEERRNKTIAMLAARGITPGSKAYIREMELLSRAENDAVKSVWAEAQNEQTRLIELESKVKAFKNAVTIDSYKLKKEELETSQTWMYRKFQVHTEAIAFVQSVRSDQLRERILVRSQHMNELSTLVHGGKIPIPPPQQFRSAKIDPAPIMDATYRSAAIEQQQWAVQVQSHNQMMGGVLGLAGNLVGGLLAFSDRRLKRDIVHLADDPRGFGWYVFRYIWGGPRRIGVMAQELVKVMPEAVVMTSSGYLAVDYGRVMA